MKKSTVAEIEQYLSERLEYIDLIIKDVVSKLPDRYFYNPEIRSGDFARIKEEMAEIRKKMKFPAYFNDSNLHRKLNSLQGEYEHSLFLLCQSKREILEQDLLAEDIEMQCACLISLIREYRLLKFLRLLK